MQITRGAAGALKVAGEAEIGQAEELRDALVDSLAQTADAAVDVSQLKSCDAAIVQVLVSAQKTAAAAGKRLVYLSASPAVLEICAALGVNLPAVPEEREHRAQ